MLTLDAPWLEMDLGRHMRVLSWSLNRPGYVTARRILWRGVTNADLPADMDVTAWLDDELAVRGARDAVVMLTSRDIRAHHTARATVGDTTVDVTATVGLSNGERVGARVDYSMRNWGTINLAARIGTGLTDTALLEAMSIATQARTAAVMDTDFALPTGRATGTGTDCIVVAAPPGEQAFAGLHTEIGEALGRAVYDAIREGAEHWKAKVFRGNADIEEGATCP